jgi:uncharacterized protein YndB with AHSA1/START domain
MRSTILLILAVAPLALLLYAATRPDDFKVARTTSIAAPPERVFPLIVDSKAFNAWNPFLKQDPVPFDRKRMIFGGCMPVVDVKVLTL